MSRGLARVDLDDVRLVPPHPDFAKTYLDWRREESFLLYNPRTELGLDAMATRLSMAGCDLRTRHSDEYRWFVTLKGELTGTVSLKSLNWPMQTGEIGYHVAERFQGLGLGAAAAALLVDKIFDEATLTRLFARVSVENLASRRVVERLGFVLEGTLREHVVIDGRRVDQWVFGLLKREWKGLTTLR